MASRELKASIPVQSPKSFGSAGALKACLSTEGHSDEEAVKKAQQSESIVGQDYVKEVTCSESFVFDADGEESIPFTVTGTNLSTNFHIDETHRLVAFDFGAKKAIYKNLRRHGFEVIVLPATATVEEVKSHSRMQFFYQMVLVIHPHWNMLIKRFRLLWTNTRFLEFVLGIKSLLTQLGLRLIN